MFLGIVGIVSHTDVPCSADTALYDPRVGILFYVQLSPPARSFDMFMTADASHLSFNILL